MGLYLEDERAETPSAFVSDDAKASIPRLIEKPIVLGAAGAKPGGPRSATL